MHDNIVLIEDHDQAYGIWKERGYKDKIIVHIDAHPDIDWFNENIPVDLLRADTLKDLDRLLKGVKVWNPNPGRNAGKPNIGNYICQAVREGIVNKIYCVLPDVFLEGRARLGYWKRRVQDIVNAIPHNKSRARIQGRRVCAEFLGRELIVCDMASLPEITSQGLLDIDTDYFTTDFDGQEYVELVHFKNKLPWIWPEQLAVALKDKIPLRALTTIAYSVDGYYTPLKFKYLGNYLGMLLSPESSDSYKLSAWRLLYQAQVCQCNGQRKEALAHLYEALRIDSVNAPVHYQMALFLYDQGEYTGAKEFYQSALRLDGSYATHFANCGELYARFGFRAAAKREYERMLVLGARDPYIHSGLAEIYRAEKDFAAAGQELTKALDIDPQNSLALHQKAESLIKLNMTAEALASYESILDRNPADLRAYVQAARLYTRLRRFDEAITCYKRIKRLGLVDAALCYRLGYLYSAKQRFTKAASCLVRALVLFFPGIFTLIREMISEQATIRRLRRYVRA